ncbi:MAG: hypothetical protein ABEI53_01450 [Candidatus Magasanikbacteria bacterium]
MKKFFINFVFTLLIVSFIYFVVAGKGLSDLLGKKAVQKIRESKPVKALQDTIIGLPSATSSDKNIFKYARSVGKSLVEAGSGSNVTSSKDGAQRRRESKKDSAKKKDKKGPLSDLLNNYSGNSSATNTSEKGTSPWSTTSELQNDSSGESKNKNNKSNKARLPEFKFMCVPEFQQVCGFSGCKKKKTGPSFFLISKKNGLIYNCVSGKCESFSFKKKIFSSSINYRFTNSNGKIVMLSRQKGKGDKFVKMESSQSEFKIYYGSCR